MQMVEGAAAAAAAAAMDGMADALGADEVRRSADVFTRENHIMNRVSTGRRERNELLVAS